MNNQTLILVYYISINNIREDNIENYINRVIEKVSASSISENTETLFIPVYGETRIDCINPKYITDGDLIKKHERLMSELHENINHHIKNSKKNDG